MKVKLALDYGVEELLTDFAAAAMTTLDVLVSRIVNGRFQEMGELLDFANACPEGSDSHDKVFALLANYDGGEYVFRAMKEIDPEYRTPEESFMSIDHTFLDDLSTSLDMHLKASSK